MPAADPVGPGALDDALLEERAGEQDGGQQEDLGHVERGHGPATEQPKHLGRARAEAADEHGGGRQRAHDAGDADDTDAGPDHGRRITGQARRRSSGL